MRDFIKVAELAKTLNVHPKTIRNYINSGRLKSLKSGGEYILTGKEALEFTREVYPDKAQALIDSEEAAPVEIPAPQPETPSIATTAPPKAKPASDWDAKRQANESEIAWIKSELELIELRAKLAQAKSKDDKPKEKITKPKSVKIVKVESSEAVK